VRADLIALAAQLTAREEAFALVTVVRREPPSSTRVGDAAVVTADGAYHGWVGGGCTRSTVLREALRAIADGEPRLLGLSPDPSAEHRPGVIALPMTCDSGGTVDIYVEPVLPAARLVLFGAAPAMQTLARIADALGYAVDVVDADADAAAFPRSARVLREIGPQGVPQRAYAVIATMSERDLDAIEAVLRSSPAYAGIVASRTRAGKLRKSLLERGVPAAALDTLTVPAGLDIGARSPEEIALSIMAQIVQRRRSAQRAEPTPASAALAVPAAPREALDPVCGMSVAVASARHRAEFDGMTYYFCCDGCRSMFLADPARYRAGAARAGAA